MYMLCTVQNKNKNADFSKSQNLKKFNQPTAADHSHNSINMSRVTRIKHLKREDDSDNFELPTPDQKIVKIKKSAGNNLHEVEGE